MLLPPVPAARGQYHGRHAAPHRLLPPHSAAGAAAAAGKAVSNPAMRAHFEETVTVCVLVDPAMLPDDLLESPLLRHRWVDANAQQRSGQVRSGQVRYM